MAKGMERRTQVERVVAHATPNMRLWHKDYFKLIIFEKMADTGEALETVEVILVREIYINKGNL